MNIELTDSLILLKAQVGSKAYGTETPESDDDFMGVILAPISCYTGLDEWNHRGTKEIKRIDGADVDATYYELKKFLRMCLDFNPNIIPLLYLDKYEVISTGGQIILDNRDMFLSQKLFHTFVGYAKSQLHAVEKGLTGKYGEKRKVLIEKYGYDVKFAYHTIRLLGMIHEFLCTKQMKVHRGHDIPYLMEIRNGKIKQSEFFYTAQWLMGEIERLFKKVTWIPLEPDYKRVNTICMQIIETLYYRFI